MPHPGVFSIETFLADLAERVELYLARQAGGTDAEPPPAGAAEHDAHDREHRRRAG